MKRKDRPDVKLMQSIMDATKMIESDQDMEKFLTVTGSGLPVHIFDKGKVKTKCGINKNKVKGISYVQHGFEFTGSKDNLCKECLSYYP